MSDKTKVLMVCLGNICRSPLAHGILEDKLDPTQYIVDSAGTAAYHVGEKPDKRSIAVARKYGLDITHQRAQKFVKQHFDEFDHIFVMDRSNYNNVLDLASTKEDHQKVKMILNEVTPGLNTEVPDPYYGGDQGFESVYEMLDLACSKIAERI